MGFLVQEIFNEWLGQHVGASALFCGFFFAAGFWCWEYLPQQLRLSRVFSAISLAASGVVFLAVGFCLIEADTGSIIWAALLGLGYYLGLRQVRLRQQRLAKPHAIK